jgi:hypothetical protein
MGVKAARVAQEISQQVMKMSAHIADHGHAWEAVVRNPHARRGLQGLRRHEPTSFPLFPAFPAHSAKVWQPEYGLEQEHR